MQIDDGGTNLRDARCIPLPNLSGFAGPDLGQENDPLSGKDGSKTVIALSNRQRPLWPIPRPQADCPPFRKSALGHIPFDFAREASIGIAVNSGTKPTDGPDGG